MSDIELTDYDKQNELDIPNDKYQYALIEGLNIQNDFELEEGKYIELLSTKFEKLYICNFGNNISLVSLVNPTIKKEKFWKMAANLIELALSYRYSFGNSYCKLKYNWIYNFDIKKFQNIKLLEPHDETNQMITSIIRINDIINLTPIIELLNRDDRAYTSMSLLNSTFDINYCCLDCELGLTDHPYHLLNEPYRWEQANYIPYLEMASVQSCRAVEALLGQPGDQDTPSKFYKFKNHWKEILNINYDSIFEIANKSYIDFYYELFHKIRNPSAHSYGNVHYDLKRKMAIQAQCFAALILKDYINKNKLDYEETFQKLNFNKDLI